MELTFQKKSLIEQIEKQRDEHKAVFEEACDKYQKKVVAELNELIRRVKAGDRVLIRSLLPVPEEHTADFDRVLSMLRQCTEKEIKLDDTTYRMYVLGEWEWIHSFASNTLSYTR